MEDSVNPVATFVPLASWFGGWIVKMIMVRLNKWSVENKWILPVAATCIGAAAGMALEYGDSYVVANAPEWVGPVWGAFFGAAATGFHEMNKRGHDAMKEFKAKRHR